MTARTAHRPSQLLSAAAVESLPGLLGLPGEMVTTRFRSENVTAIVELDQAAIAARAATYPEPITDRLTLEWETGLDDAPPWWVRPIRLHALIVQRRQPLRAVYRAARWCSYGARVAVVPQERITRRIHAEAILREMWLVGVAQDGSVQLRHRGADQPLEGSAQHLAHRLLDELLWEALTGKQLTAEATRSARSA